MKTLSVLIVDDDQGMVNLFNDEASDWNIENKVNGKELLITSEATVHRAMEALGKLSFDAVIVDLRLPIVDTDTTGGDAKNGIDLALSTISQKGIPVAIASGYPGELSNEISELEHIKFFSKSKGYKPVIAWLSDHWNMMETLALARQQIEMCTREVFAKRIWPNWKDIEAMTNPKDGNSLLEIVTRQYAGQVAEFLGDAAKWHPHENYIIPSMISDRAHTGDLFNFDGEIWLILSPQCDMTNQNIPNVLMAMCTQGGNNEWTAHIGKLKENPNTEKSQKQIRKFVNQDISKSKHFLPPLPSTTEAIFVCFDIMKTVPLNEINKVLDKRIATVSPPFLGNLVQRFGSYISRTGQPNIDINHLY